MDFILGKAGGREREQEHGEKSCIVSYNNFIFIDKFLLFCKQRLFVILMHK